MRFKREIAAPDLRSPQRLPGIREFAMQKKPKYGEFTRRKSESQKIPGYANDVL
jgi:hypothetical protein